MSQPPVISSVGFCTGTGEGDLRVLEAGLRRMDELGATVAELSLYGEDLIAGGRVIEGRARRLADICKPYSFRYTVHGLIASNFMDAAHLPLQKAVVRAMLELCERVGATVLVHHAGHAPAGRPVDHARYDALEREALAELAEVARGYGVRIALENIFAMGDGEYRQTPGQIAETVRAIGHPNLCALLDFSHAYIECTRRGLDWRAEVRAMAPVSGHLHLHDSFGRPYSMKRFYHPCEATALGIGDLHLPLGWGDIPWDELFAELTFLPDTALVLEITERYDLELPDCLAQARALAARLNERAAARAA